MGIFGQSACVALRWPSPTYNFLSCQIDPKLMNHGYLVDLEMTKSKPRLQGPNKWGLRLLQGWPVGSLPPCRDDNARHLATIISTSSLYRPVNVNAIKYLHTLPKTNIQKPPRSPNHVCLPESERLLTLHCYRQGWLLAHFAACPVNGQVKWWHLMSLVWGLGSSQLPNCWLARLTIHASNVINTINTSKYL